MSSYPFQMLGIILAMLFLFSDVRNKSIDILLYQSRRYFSQNIRLLPTLSDSVLIEQCINYCYYLVFFKNEQKWII